MWYSNEGVGEFEYKYELLVGEETMLLEFETMNEEEVYRMVRAVYPEGSFEIAKEKYPELTDLSVAIQEEETYLVGFLEKFMVKEQNRYYKGKRRM